MIIRYKKQLTLCLEYNLMDRLSFWGTFMGYYFKYTLICIIKKKLLFLFKNRSPRKNYDVCHQTNAAATRATQT